MPSIRVRVVAAWAVAMLLALFFIQTGLGKLNPSPALIRAIRGLGLQWRLRTGRRRDRDHRGR